MFKIKKINTESIFQGALCFNGLIILAIATGIIISLTIGSLFSFEEYGLNFIFSMDWNPTEGREVYGALPFIAGTLITSILALFLTFPFSFSIALLLGEYYKNGKFPEILRSIIDLLAGVPSVVYGLWGFYTIKPLIVFLGFNDQGYGVFTASLVLAIMIIPYATSLSIEVIKMVPKDLKEATYSLGATRYEVVKNVIIPSASSGIVAGFILALGRALGETMAVTMLIGNVNKIPTGLFDTGNTMASLIANQFGEAEGIKLSSLFEIALILLLITGIINFFGKLVMKKLAA